jgi:4-amino-4-deoxy-L-arabinose transferase-like glycosyltransferase
MDGRHARFKIGLLLFAGILCVGGLTSGELIRNEGLRARLVQEAQSTGSWLVPTLYGEPHLAKPPGMTLAIALCSLPAGGITAWSARLPSVVAGLVVVLLFYQTFKRSLGKQGGLIAAAILPCSALWLERVPSAEIDLVQLAWVTGSVVCLLRAVEGASANSLAIPPQFSEPRLNQETALWWLAALGCVAGGLFTKWTAPAFFYLTAVPFLAVQGRVRVLFRLPHLMAAGLVAVLALTWLSLAGQTAGWSTLLDTLGREALLRLSPGHHPRPYPWDELITFPLSFLAANLPWSACALIALRPSFARLWNEHERQLLVLCQAWLWANLLFWTLAPGHRPRHLLPAQPALAGLAAFVWIAWLTGRLRWPIRRIGPVGVLGGLLVGWLVVKLVFVAAVVPSRQAHRHPRSGGEALARIVPAGELLYLFRVKDEGLLFYYGRPARRLHEPAAVPPAGGWCLLTDSEWRQWRGPGTAEVRASLHDGQGAPLVLVRTGAQEKQR